MLLFSSTTGITIGLKFVFRPSKSCKGYSYIINVVLARVSHFMPTKFYVVFSILKMMAGLLMTGLTIDQTAKMIQIHDIMRIVK